LSRLPFLATVVAVTILSFVWLAARTRPPRGGPGIEPVLYVSGLHQPRSLAVGGDDALYFAEAGWSAGSTAAAGSTSGPETVPGRISRVDGRELATVVAPELPPARADASLFAQAGPVSLAPLGAADLALVLGPSEGQPLGSVARLTTPPRSEPPAGDRQAIDPYPLVVDGQGAGASTAPAAVWGTARGNGGAVFATLPLANLLIRLDPATGRAMPVTGFIGAGGSNPMPTGVAPAPGGSLFVAHFGPQPYRRGSGRVVQVGADGLWQPRFESLTFPVALAIAPDGQLYVLELAAGYDAGTGQFTPRSGRVLAL
jgi:hypothetical protein